MIWRISAAALAALALAGPAAGARGGCHTVAGTFVAAPAACPPGFAFCTSGALFGDLDGGYEFTGDFGGPGLVGASTITLDTGAVIQGSDESTLAGLDFVTVVTFVGGTRQFAHATGSLTATGSIDPVTGGTAGTYEGEFCLGVAGGLD